MKKIIKCLSLTNWTYELAVKLIANRIVHGDNLLTSDYLKSKGFIYENHFWIEPNVKLRDRIWVQFENHYFRVYHGEKITFVALESKLEWFENYYLLLHGDNGRYELAGI